MDYSNIQSLILYAYKDLHHAQFLMFKIEHPGLFQQWLSDNVSHFTTSNEKPIPNALNIAFTAPGLKKLGLPDNIYEQFSREFKEGMSTEKRARLLGDFGTNAPDQWDWGGSNTETIDVLLLCYAESTEQLNNNVSDISNELEAYTTIISNLSTEALFDRKEHFGFKDGIAQPRIIGVHSPHSQNTPNDLLPAGELLLGHKNGYGSVSHAPSNSEGFLNFGHDGSYLVFRQLEQDVKGFWQYLEQQNSDEDNKVLLASKMVGRWPNGASLNLHPTAEPEHLNPNTANAFDYSDDPTGIQCPIASHVRRTNPRATDLGLTDKEESIKSVNHHRIMRRGRPYGKPLHKKLSPSAMLKAEETGAARGLHFLCFNADIARQFEFIQQSWVNNEKFCGLYNDLDPLLGPRNSEPDLAEGNFTIPQQPIRKRLKNLPQFVTTKGGAYFFMPSVQALQQLAGCSE